MKNTLKMHIFFRRRYRGHPYISWSAAGKGGGREQKCHHAVRGGGGGLTQVSADNLRIW